MDILMTTLALWAWEVKKAVGGFRPWMLRMFARLWQGIWKLQGVWSQGGHDVVRP